MTIGATRLTTDKRATGGQRATARQDELLSAERAISKAKRAICSRMLNQEVVKSQSPRNKE
jgi:hypothetical protein